MKWVDSRAVNKTDFYYFARVRSVCDKEKESILIEQTIT